jgi:alpha-tubulin suppressor-like RCC1 family protein
VRHRIEQHGPVLGLQLDGQLGNGTTTTPSTPQSTPVTVTGLTGASALALGDVHTCALSTDGTVRCWGGNTSGALGDGLMADASTPQLVSIPGKAVSIAAGPSSACAVLSNGAVVCWGAGPEIGSPVDALSPVATPDW